MANKGGRRVRAGRPPKATEQKVLQGTWRQDRHGAEPTVAAKWPAVPAHLNERERELWAGLEAHCAAWTAPSDWIAVNGLVSLMDIVLRLQAMQRAVLAVTPEAATDPEAKQRAENVAIAFATAMLDGSLEAREIKAWRELRMYIAILGLSPVDRARVGGSSKPEAPAVDPMAKFLKRG